MQLDNSILLCIAVSKKHYSSQPASSYENSQLLSTLDMRNVYYIIVDLHYIINKHLLYSIMKSDFRACIKLIKLPQLFIDFLLSLDKTINPKKLLY